MHFPVEKRTFLQKKPFTRYIAGISRELQEGFRAQGAKSAHRTEDVTTLIIDEVHNPSVQSDYALALTPEATQTTSRIRLVLMSAMGDHELVEKRIPFCRPIVHSDHLLCNITQVVVARRNNRAGPPLVEHTNEKDGVPNPSNNIMVFVPGVPQIRQLHDMQTTSIRPRLDVGTNALRVSWAEL